MSSASASAALTGVALGSISPSECEFLAKETLIKISPKFHHPKLKFISGTFGPFDPMVTIFVPLWLAVTLRKKEKCSIVIPDWLSVDTLQRDIESEKSSGEFVALPPHFLEVASILFDCCKEDIENADRVQGLIQDLESIRADRLRIGMLSVAKTSISGQRVESVKLKNITSLEILSIKKFFLQSMQTFDNLLPTQTQDTSAIGTSAPAGQAAGTTGGGRKLRKHRK